MVLNKVITFVNLKLSGFLKLIGNHFILRREIELQAVWVYYLTGLSDVVFPTMI